MIQWYRICPHDRCLIRIWPYCSLIPYTTTVSSLVVINSHPSTIFKNIYTHHQIETMEILDARRIYQIENSGIEPKQDVRRYTISHKCVWKITVLAYGWKYTVGHGSVACAVTQAPCARQRHCRFTWYNWQYKLCWIDRSHMADTAFDSSQYINPHGYSRNLPLRSRRPVQE